MVTYSQFHKLHIVYFKKKRWWGVGDKALLLMYYKKLFCTARSLATTADLRQMLSLRMWLKIPTFNIAMDLQLC
jgi:hypothetical protein